MLFRSLAQNHGRGIGKYHCVYWKLERPTRGKTRRNDNHHKEEKRPKEDEIDAFGWRITTVSVQVYDDSSPDKWDSSVSRWPTVVALR